MSKTYLIWSQSGYEISGRYNSASVPKASGGRQTVQYTVMVDNPSEIKYPDKIIVWQGDRNDIRDTRPNRPLSTPKRIRLVPLHHPKK